MSLLGDFREGAVVIVVIKEVATVKIGDVEVDIPVVVVIGGHHGLGKGDSVRPGGMVDILKCAVAPVVEELAGAVFVAHEQIELAIIIDVGPDGRLSGRRRLCQAGLPRDIGECAVTVIPHQRFAHGEFPGSAQDEEVRAPVIVVIGLDHVEAAELVEKARLRGSIRESAIFVVVIKAQRSAHIVGRDGHI